MAQFQKLLLAIDLSPLSELLIRRVRAVYSDDMDHLYVVHVLTQGLHDSELAAACDVPDEELAYLIEYQAQKVRKFLIQTGLDIPAERILLVHGEPACEIKKMANKINADLVIVGSHSKDGDWLKLPGATTNCVIQGIASDVMAVKV